ncbi:phycobiliprotein asparagine N-methyltransferase [Stanieria cyanosphaera PCC 7437]|uniref:Phycobiliprotein asparagine N-methyltransferase n=1 Tax=Stanieria cyanosphaera (strain ATCC 29371 / PCC 7437) TaxID=111780 RepID=K9XW31_STAC7|nr:class I SAM-dependent methyltransferase [Stanieria cyanosphaera]AFZ36743.1 phycobiliprotein asparagine N-methyltransferase [Stanieria cyanosphaera PCC 7437]
MSDLQAINTAVANLYNTYPFPPDPLSDQLPPGYNWRWSWTAAYNFCTGKKPSRQDIRILDAGCGTGSGTDYLIHLNPEADIVAIDLSEKALEVAQERCHRSGAIANHAKSVEFHHLKLEQATQLPGEFDFINCVGVLHHLPDPIKGIQALASKLAPGGLLHIFVYAELGRWEIALMQKAIALLQGDQRGDYRDGVQVGRQIFAALPENNRILKQEKERWALENHRDEAFADMYVHPQEIDYNIETLFELIDASGLEFVGFSNRNYWELSRLIGNSPELLARSQTLNDRQIYRLIELLDPSLTHYEFFLARQPLPKIDWTDDQMLLSAIAELHPCMQGWPSRSFFDYDYQLVNLSEAEYQFMTACEQQHTNVRQLITDCSVDLNLVRSLWARQLIILSPSEKIPEKS